MASTSIASAVGIGIVGLGRMGMYHLERLSLRDDCRPVAGFDLNGSAESRLQGFDCRFVNSWQEFLDAPDTEMILIATPPDTHAALAIEALSHGKHVIVEKPLCLTSADADSMLAAARRANRMLSVVQNRRWDGDFRAALTAVQSGGLGRLRAIKLVNWEYGLHNETADGELADWRGDSDRSGGALFEFGAHYFDLLLQLVPDRIQNIYAQIPNCDGNGQSADEGFLTIVNFCTGVTAQIEVNLSSPTPLCTGWTLAGTKGGYHNYRAYTRTEDGEIYSSPVETTAIEWDEFYTGIVRHLRQNTRLPVTAEEARRVVCLIEAAQRSADIGQVVSIP